MSNKAIVILEMPWKEQFGHTKPKGFEAYILPTNEVHESGFRMFEVGYCKLDDDKRVCEKIILGYHSDHIWFQNQVPSDYVSLSIDLTLDGYIRLFDDVIWRNVLSSAILQPIRNNQS